MKDLWTLEITTKLKSNLYIGPENIFLSFVIDIGIPWQMHLLWYTPLYAYMRQ